jgi:hypothetical protein
MDVTTEEELGSALSRSVCFTIAHTSKSLPIYAMADKIRHTMSQKHNTKDFMGLGFPGLEF